MFAKSLINVSPLMTALGACLLAVGCGATADSGDPTFASRDEALSTKCPPPVPTTLAVPDGNKLAFSLDAIGVQIYSCNATANGYAWTFVAPEADLLDPGGEVVGIHYAGPTWQSEDGSKVVAAKVWGETVDPTAIQWLLLKAVSHDGDGRMDKVSYIQRLDTGGGLAPTTACDSSNAGDMSRISYTATYYFYEPSQGRGGGPVCE